MVHAASQYARTALEALLRGDGHHSSIEIDPVDRGTLRDVCFAIARSCGVGDILHVRADAGGIRPRTTDIQVVSPHGIGRLVQGRKADYGFVLVDCPDSGMPWARSALGPLLESSMAERTLVVVEDDRFTFTRVSDPTFLDGPDLLSLFENAYAGSAPTP